MAPKVLIVLTSADKIPKADNKPTGWYLPELAHPYAVLSPHADLVFASPAGGVAPLDPTSVEMFKSDSTSIDFLNKHKSLWENTEKLSSFLGRASEFDALFYPGGHGPMFDLATDPESHRLINEFADAGKIVAAVCHGPAVFAFVKRSDGTPFLKGATVTGFTNEEEAAVGLDKAMPFLLETALREAAGSFEKADSPWGEKVVVDREGKLITGQNPASAGGVGEAILKGLKV